MSDQPENLILHTDEKGQDTVKLIDFGFAHVNDTQDAMMHTACTLLATSLAFLPHPPSRRPSRRPHTPPVVFMHIRTDHTTPPLGGTPQYVAPEIVDVMAGKSPNYGPPVVRVHTLCIMYYDLQVNSVCCRAQVLCMGSAALTYTRNTPVSLHSPFLLLPILSGTMFQDIWATGVIMFILLVGFPPFYHENDKVRT